MFAKTFIINFAKKWNGMGMGMQGIFVLDFQNQTKLKINLNKLEKHYISSSTYFIT